MRRRRPWAPKLLTRAVMLYFALSLAVFLFMGAATAAVEGLAVVVGSSFGSGFCAAVVWSALRPLTLPEVKEA